LKEMSREATHCVRTPQTIKVTKEKEYLKKKNL